VKWRQKLDDKDMHIQDFSMYHRGFVNDYQILIIREICQTESNIRSNGMCMRHWKQTNIWIKKFK